MFPCLSGTQALAYRGECQVCPEDGDEDDDWCCSLEEEDLQYKKVLGDFVLFAARGVNVRGCPPPRRDL